MYSYIPKCELNCSDRGECVNNDFCICKSNFKGKYCNEYIKLERNSLIDISLIIIALILIFFIIMLIGMTIYYRNNLIIKGGNN